MTPRHLFVSGPPRSGTTLLQLALSSHPEITITPECRSIQQIFRHGWDPQGPLDGRMAQKVQKIMDRDEKLAGWPSVEKEELIGLVQPGMTVPQILDALFLTFAHKTGGGARVVGNKKGLYSSGMGAYTKKAFPDAKFLYIVRDPRDVVRSMVDNLDRSLDAAARECARRDRCIAKMQQKWPQDVMTIRYEDLVLDPARVLAQVCRPLGLEYDDRMLEYHLANRGAARLIDKTKHIHQNTTKAVSSSFTARWRKEGTFKEEELQRIETTTKEYMTRYDYPPEASGRGRLAHALARTDPRRILKRSG